MTDLRRIVKVLTEAKIEFILVGGAAATAHGASRLTQDIDIVYCRSAENIQRLVDVLGPYDPYMRGAPPGLPFLWDSTTIHRGLNFTLTTSLGDLDLLGEIAGGGGYEELLPHTMTLEAFGIECLCLKIEPLIRVKRAAGRPKDLEAIAELEALLEERTERE
ncbi:MAG: hypothetical protein GXX96_00900 [Planctomycetaceae bacterium]|jgi:predicted nucleotidyltransferase|nr:hypothetical protein [Planctomycetaceae bacterium]